MSYVKKDYYDEVYHGEPVDLADFPSLLMRAEELVEELTLYRLSPESFQVMPSSTQERVKKAVCAQLEYLNANGGADMDNRLDIQSATLGKFSFSKSSGVSGNAESSLFAPRAERFLWPTGLIYKGGQF